MGGKSMMNDSKNKNYYFLPFLQKAYFSCGKPKICDISRNLYQ